MSGPNDAGDTVDQALDQLDVDDVDTGDDAGSDDLSAGGGDEDDDDVDAAEADGDDDDEDDEPAGGKKPNGDQPQRNRKSAKQRIAEKTRAENDAKRERDFYKQQLEDERRQRAEESRTRRREVEPTAEEIEAGRQQGFSEEQVRQIVADEARQAEARATARVEISQKVTSLKAKLSDGGATAAFDRLANPALTKFEKIALDALTECKYPAKVAKAITSNEKLFSEFSSAPDGAARARIIATVDGRLQGRASVAGKRSDDIRPTRQVRGSSRRSDPDPEKMDQEQYERWRAKQYGRKS